MEITRNKIILYILIITTGIDFILPWPILQQKSSADINLLPQKQDEFRFSRQVVQPKWLNIQREPIIDPTVHVNQEALEEAEMIRKTIQTTVDEDTYAVTGEEPDPNIPPMEPQEPLRTSELEGERNSPYALPLWYIQMRKLWQNWARSLFKGFRS